MGYIKLFRKLTDWDRYDDLNMLGLWIHLLLEANWEDSEFRKKTIPRGSLLISVPVLAKRFKLTERQVRYMLNCLEDGGEIVKELSGRQLLITICKYDSYQSKIENDCHDDVSEIVTSMSAKLSPPIVKEDKEDKNISVTPLSNTITKVIDITLPPKSGGKREQKISRSDISLPYDSQKFKETWNKLINEPKWKKKSPTALEMSLKKLGKYDEEFAILLMNESIENNWQGVVFDSTDEKYAKWKANPSSGKREGCKPSWVKEGERYSFSFFMEHERELHVIGEDLRKHVLRGGAIEWVDGNWTKIG